VKHLKPYLIAFLFLLLIILPFQIKAYAQPNLSATAMNKLKLIEGFSVATTKKALPFSEIIIKTKNINELKNDTLQTKKKRLVIHDQWLARDKALHFGVSLISVLAIKTLADNSLNFERDAATFAGAGIAFSLGFGKEVWDGQKPNNHFSYKDLVADVAGILIGVLIIQAF